MQVVQLLVPQLVAHRQVLVLELLLQVLLLFLEPHLLLLLGLQLSRFRLRLPHLLLLVIVQVIFQILLVGVTISDQLLDRIFLVHWPVLSHLFQRVLNYFYLNVYQVVDVSAALILHAQVLPLLKLSYVLLHQLVVLWQLLQLGLVHAFQEVKIHFAELLIIVACRLPVGILPLLILHLRLDVRVRGYNARVFLRDRQQVVLDRPQLVLFRIHHLLSASRLLV